MRDLFERIRHPSQDVLYGLIAAGLILGSVVARLSMVRDVAAPNILCDEFIYAGIARGSPRATAMPTAASTSTSAGSTPC